VWSWGIGRGGGVSVGPAAAEFPGGSRRIGINRESDGHGQRPGEGARTVRLGSKGRLRGWDRAARLAVACMPLPDAFAWLVDAYSAEYSEKLTIFSRSSGRCGVPGLIAFWVSLLGSFGQRSMVKGRWSKVDGQRSIGQRSMIDGARAPCNPLYPFYLPLPRLISDDPELTSITTHVIAAARFSSSIWVCRV